MLAVWVAFFQEFQQKSCGQVFLNGGVVSTDRLAASKAAIVEGWYPGISGSAALAKSLFGISNKWGKLPNTVRRCFLDSPRTFASR